MTDSSCEQVPPSANQRRRDSDLGHVQYISAACDITQRQRSSVGAVQAWGLTCRHKFTLEYQSQKKRKEESLAVVALVDNDFRSKSPGRALLMLD